MAVLFRIGARGSKLSLAQTELVRAALAARLDADAAALEVVPITTRCSTDALISPCIR
jgi:porphobilinogen deaminase